jgi:hypothetical protein
MASSRAHGWNATAELAQNSASAMKSSAVMSHSKALSGPTVGDWTSDMFQMGTAERHRQVRAGVQRSNRSSSALHSGRKSMKRTFALILAALAAGALFGGLVHAVLVAAHVSEPAATTVQGLTAQRLWAATVAVLALVGVVIGGLALARPNSRFGTASGRLGAIVALVAGPIAVVNGWLVLAIANGGPGTGNGVVGGAAALVLGLISTTLGGLALARSRGIALG